MKVAILDISLLVKGMRSTIGGVIARGTSGGTVFTSAIGNTMFLSQGRTKYVAFVIEIMKDTVYTEENHKSVFRVFYYKYRNQ